MSDQQRDADLFGYVEGAEVIDVEVTRPIIDSLNGAVFAQRKRTTSVRPLTMDLLVPRTNELKPAIVYYPGGGFIEAPNGKFAQMRMALAEAGFVVAAAEYRAVPDQFPAIIEDGKSAVRYVRAHADEYGIDPTRVGILGNSAGGYITEFLGVTNGTRAFDVGDFLDQSSEVQAAASIFGISNMMSIAEGFEEELVKVHDSPAVTEALLVNGVALVRAGGGSIHDKPEAIMAASAMGNLTDQNPPFLLMHGDKDKLVSPLQSAELYKALKERGADVQYVLIRGGEHGDPCWFQASLIERVVEWFKGKLGRPAEQDARTKDARSNL